MKDKKQYKVNCRHAAESLFNCFQAFYVYITNETKISILPFNSKQDRFFYGIFLLHKNTVY